jgi:hypothetical protein
MRAAPEPFVPDATAVVGTCDGREPDGDEHPTPERARTNGTHNAARNPPMLAEAEPVEIPTQGCAVDTDDPLPPGPRAWPFSGGN